MASWAVGPYLGGGGIPSPVLYSSPGWGPLGSLLGPLTAYQYNDPYNDPYYGYGYGYGMDPADIDALLTMGFITGAEYAQMMQLGGRRRGGRRWGFGGMLGGGMYGRGFGLFGGIGGFGGLGGGWNDRRLNPYLRGPGT